MIPVIENKAYRSSYLGRYIHFKTQIIFEQVKFFAIFDTVYQTKFDFSEFFINVTEKTI